MSSVNEVISCCVFEWEDLSSMAEIFQDAGGARTIQVGDDAEGRLKEITHPSNW
ncbi:MAG: hypothetical protein GY906_29495 [bacterium]|nr:hypothetical protein [bacterium]